MPTKTCIIGCMIVKDEEPIIARTLDVFTALVDYWIISDTGSTDNTKQIVADWLLSHNGQLLEHEWSDYSTNRNYVFEEAKKYQRLNANKRCFNVTIDAGDSCEDASILKRIIQSKFNHIAVMRVSTLIINRTQRVITHYSDSYRGFKTSLYPAIKYKYKIHEMLTIPQRCANKILHIVPKRFNFIHDYGNDTPSAHRYESDLQILLEEVEEARKLNDTNTDWHAFHYASQTYALMGNPEPGIVLLNEWLNRAAKRDSPLQILNICCMRVIHSSFKNQEYIDEVYNYAEAQHIDVSQLESLKRVATTHLLTNLENDREHAMMLLSKVTKDVDQMEEVLGSILTNVRRAKKEAGAK